MTPRSRFYKGGGFDSVNNVKGVIVDTSGLGQGYNRGGRLADGSTEFATIRGEVWETQNWASLRPLVQKAIRALT